jgi:hypothetical protein
MTSPCSGKIGSNSISGGFISLVRNSSIVTATSLICWPLLHHLSTQKYLEPTRESLEGPAVFSPFAQIFWPGSSCNLNDSTLPKRDAIFLAAFGLVRVSSHWSAYGPPPSGPSVFRSDTVSTWYRNWSC